VRNSPGLFDGSKQAFRIPDSFGFSASLSVMHSFHPQSYNVVAIAPAITQEVEEELKAKEIS
jgi:hypothetical protein